MPRSSREKSNICTSLEYLSELLLLIPALRSSTRYSTSTGNTTYTRDCYLLQTLILRFVFAIAVAGITPPAGDPSNTLRSFHEQRGIWIWMGSQKFWKRCLFRIDLTTLKSYNLGIFLMLQKHLLCSVRCRHHRGLLKQ